jgi:hypothetical protein
MAASGKILLAAVAAMIAVQLVGGPGSTPVARAGPDPIPSAPCYNGIYPFNPYVNNCALPQRPPRTLGSAPDQTALLNCDFGGRAWRAQCLSLFVNGGYGWYPGATLVPGYRP